MAIREAKVLGILGGMGPTATVDFFSKVVASTPATTDQEHLRVIIDSNPRIPDRMDAILRNGRSPLPELLATAANLEKAGSDFLAMPCNSAHLYYEMLAEGVSIPILHMIREVVRAVLSLFPEIRRVGLLATNGTIVSRLYDKEFDSAGVLVVVPGSEDQRDVTDAIKQIKAGNRTGRARENLLRAGTNLTERDAEAIILGCTEIPSMVHAADYAAPVLDATLLLAQAAVKYALSES